VEATGFVDVWRLFNPKATEFTWFSQQRRGFRVDHAFASPSLISRIKDARYSHAEREDGLSDHSIQLVDIAQFK
jgi:exonuclease III